MRVDAILVVGTRPELIKAMPVVMALESMGLDWRIFLTGQHPRRIMMPAARDLQIPSNRIVNSSGRGPTHISSDLTWQDCAGSALASFLRSSVRLGIVIGDTNSALLGAETLSRSKIPVLHVEAGLRLSMLIEPEEVNRRRITQLSTWHFAPFQEQRSHLISSGIPTDRIVVTGDFSELSLRYRLRVAGWSISPSKREQTYWIVTVHRRSNLTRLNSIAQFLRRFACRTGYRLVVCLRPDPRLQAFYEIVASSYGMSAVPPQDPRPFLHLLSGANGVVTDSAGVQQEAILGSIPVVGIRSEVELYGSRKNLLLADHLDDVRVSSELTGLDCRTWSFTAAPLGVEIQIMSSFLSEAL